jgi:hypothetical protein
VGHPFSVRSTRRSTQLASAEMQAYPWADVEYTAAARGHRLLAANSSSANVYTMELLRIAKQIQPALQVRDR